MCLVNCSFSQYMHLFYCLLARSFRLEKPCLFLLAHWSLVPWSFIHDMHHFDCLLASSFRLDYPCILACLLAHSGRTCMYFSACSLVHSARICVYFSACSLAHSDLVMSNHCLFSLLARSFSHNLLSFFLLARSIPLTSVSLCCSLSPMRLYNMCTCHPNFLIGALDTQAFWTHLILTWNMLLTKKNLLTTKNFGPTTIFGPETKCGPKKFFGPEIFGPKMFWTQNFGPKNVWTFC